MAYTLTDSGLTRLSLSHIFQHCQQEVLYVIIYMHHTSLCSPVKQVSVPVVLQKQKAASLFIIILNHSVNNLFLCDPPGESNTYSFTGLITVAIEGHTQI